MYIKKLEFKNYGPVDSFILEPRFRKDGSPIPIVLMGKNGSGKTLIEAHILQAILNFKSELYNDIPEKDKSQLYKIQSTSYIKNGHVDSKAYILFDDNNADYMEILSNNPEKTINDEYYKEYSTRINNEKFKKDGMIRLSNGKVNYDNNVFLFFPVDRYYKPYWENENVNNELRTYDRIIGKNDRNVVCRNPQANLTSFILNTVIDRELYDEKRYIKYNDRFLIDKNGNPQLSYIGKNNSIIEFINNILSTFKSDEYVSKRIYVSEKKNRKIGVMGIKKDGTEEEIIDSLNKLSTGEFSLLSMFLSVVSDYEKTNNIGTFNFQNIKGIVVIDEAELNLHIDLQMNTLPQLMKKFKNIQFIISTQSPFLIYGLKDLFKEECDIFDLPNGIKVDNVLDLGEVKKSYDEILKHNSDTIIEVNNAREEIIKSKNDLIVITEGKTDPIYLQKAQEKNKYLNDKSIKYIGLNTPETNKYSESGWGGLNKLAEALTVIPPQTPVVLLYDRDTLIAEMLKNEYLKFGDNVYKMCIPLPSNRKSFDEKDLCIEHYFTNEEIKRKDKNGRRLYLGCEFNTNGINYKEKLMCNAIDKCGKNSIKILDGSGKTKVYKLTDESKTNLALTKNDFANYIKNDCENYNNYNYKEYEKIFNIFGKIIQENNREN